MAGQPPPFSRRLRGPELQPFPPPPPWRPVLPDPGGVTENGRVPCNEPMIVNGQTVAYCTRFVKYRRRGRERGTHRGPHRYEWWS